MRTLRTGVVWSVGSLVLLLSPAVALLLVVTAEMVIDVLIEAGVPTVFCLITAAAIGRALLRNRSLNADDLLSGSRRNSATKRLLQSRPT